MYSRRFRIKGWSHKICFRGFLGEKESLLLVQWFSGSVVFQECSFAVRGLCSSFSKLFGVKINRRRFKQGGGNWDRNRLGLGIGIKGGKVSRD